MKGIVFREFIEMVESEFSYEVADATITASQLSTGGAYTSIGTYPHQEMVDLVVNLSHITQQPVPALLQHFGRHLFQRFTQVHPEQVHSHNSAFELLQRLDGTIHVEVKKIYPEAELPAFTYQQANDHCMVFEYHSKRALADFAEGLIQGCIAHFGEPMQIERLDLPTDDEGAHTRFTLKRHSPAGA